MKEKVSTKKYYMFYTLAFIVVSLCIFTQFVYYGKTMIENYDALYQYYAAFEYFTDYIQSIITTLFSTGKLEIPLWDFTIGMGGDILTSLNYYVIGDPLNLIGAFFRNEQLEIVFQFLIIFRLYLAGLLFSVFCRKLGYQSWYTAIGALIYTFSMFSLYSACMYAAFLNTLIYLPLLLLGVEKVFRKESGKVLMFSTALCLISNFYFSYMLAAITLIYCIVRYCVVNVYKIRNNEKGHCKEIAKNFATLFMHMLVPVLGGLFLSCVVLIPVIYVFMNQGRGTGQVVENLWVYQPQKYIEIFSSMFSPKLAGDYNLMGYCPIVLLSIFVILSKPCREKRQNLVLKVLFIISAVFLLIPVFGYAMNGFAYLNNRWIFGVAFLCAFGVVATFEDFFHLTNREKKVLTCGTIIYLGLYVLIKQLHNTVVSTGGIWLFVLLALVFAVNVMNITNEKKNCLLMTACIVCVCYYGYFFYSPQNTTIMQTKLNINETQNIDERTSAGAVSCIKDKSFYRVDVKDWTTLNEALMLHYPSVAFYYSLYDGKITQFNEELENAMMSVPNLSHGNSGRTYLNLLTNVKYLVSNKKETEPYGYSLYDSYELENGAKKNVFENKLYLPFGYTVTDYFLRDEYLKLSPLKKEQVMLQGVILEESKEDMNQLVPAYTDQSIPYTVKDTDGVKFSENKICVTKQNATLTLHTDIPQNTEVFVRGTGIQFHAYTPWEKPKYYEGDMPDNTYEKRLWQEQYENWTSPGRVVIKAKINQIGQSIPLYQENYKYYWNQDSFLLSLGTQNSGAQDIVLTFSELGEYDYSELEVLTEDMTVLPEQVEKIKEEPLENVKFSTNKIQGNITTKGKRMLLLSVPYSSGWSVKVDGQEKELICANTMWSAVYLEDAGNHEIVLTYQTPGLKIGLIISLVTLFFVCGYCMIIKYRKK